VADELFRAQLAGGDPPGRHRGGEEVGRLHA
jgi:hypothetical protein